jgi:hypothetical protein
MRSKMSPLAMKENRMTNIEREIHEMRVIYFA